MDLPKLLRTSDVVSLHLPRNATVLGEPEFALLKDGAILVNTSLGKPFDPDAFFVWTRRNRDNIGVFDMAGAEGVAAAGAGCPNCIVYPRSSGFTAEARVRLTRKVHENMTAFLKTCS